MSVSEQQLRALDALAAEGSGATEAERATAKRIAARLRGQHEAQSAERGRAFADNVRRRFGDQPFATIADDLPRCAVPSRPVPEGFAEVSILDFFEPYDELGRRRKLPGTPPETRPVARPV
jgi:hypothetical protein